VPIPTIGNTENEQHADRAGERRIKAGAVIAYAKPIGREPARMQLCRFSMHAPPKSFYVPGSENVEAGRVESQRNADENRNNFASLEGDLWRIVFRLWYFFAQKMHC
jgi:hypothetical protein